MIFKMADQNYFQFKWRSRSKEISNKRLGKAHEGDKGVNTFCVWSYAPEVIGASGLALMIAVTSAIKVDKT